MHLTIFNWDKSALLCLLAGMLVVSSCAERGGIDQETKSGESKQPAAQVVSFRQDKPLSISEYQQWLKSQHGITYAEQENEYIMLSVLYKPLKYEAAISGGASSAEEVEKLMKVKSAYHHLTVECLDKNTSVSKKTNKEALFGQLRESFFVVKNQTDTIKSAVLEIFPASLLNQPHKVMVLIPRDSADKTVRAGIKGSPFGLADVYINIEEEHFKFFPEIKI